MDQRALPLLLASRQVAPEAELKQLDRLRMQNGVFLLQQKGPKSWRIFPFRPYDWGPYSKELAATLSELATDGSVDLDRSRPYGAYRTSGPGEDVAAEVFEGLSDQEEELIRRVRAFVTSRSFSQLLKEIYAAYPEYAVASRFRAVS